ncbi:DSK2A [Enterospora canceri]|uniref:DSK2A n=1 Tax=Enterospora canceri TaxID=1081671 RepID=A0A1Y1S7E8_9MICR|nr:DSK2A [Enterospora canceri]
MEIRSNETVEDIKERAAALFQLQLAEVVLFYRNRSLNSDYKCCHELGIEEGVTIVVKRNVKVGEGRKESSMQEMLKNPAMKNMLKNPNTLKSIKKMFLANEENEDVKTSQLGALLNEEGIEDELERMTENTEYLNSQMRNADLAMAKLENMPGGMNMMSSMLKDVEDPLKRLQRKTYNAGSEMSTRQESFIPGKVKMNPHVQYRKQNASMIEKGFADGLMNIDALVKTGGNESQAIELVLEKLDQEQ